MIAKRRMLPTIAQRPFSSKSLCIVKKTMISPTSKSNTTSLDIFMLLTSLQNAHTQESHPRMSRWDNRLDRALRR